MHATYSEMIHLLGRKSTDYVMGVKRIILVITIIGFQFLLFNCSRDDDSSTSDEVQIRTTGAVQIRIKNASQYNYSNILVNTNGGENNYGNISASKTTKYGGFDFAYRYAFVELKINGQIFTIQPIDYVGETKLTPGKYTYEIGANDSAQRYGKLTIKLFKD